MFPQGWHWPRTAATGSPTTTETVVYWAARYGLASYQLSVVQWTAGYYNAHAELKIVIVDSCPAGKNCVLWRTGQNRGGSTSVSTGSSSHIIASTVTLDDQVIYDFSGRWVAFHEACHSFGGGFRSDIHQFCDWEYRGNIFYEIARVYHDDPG